MEVLFTKYCKEKSIKSFTSQRARIQDLQCSFAIGSSHMHKHEFFALVDRVKMLSRFPGRRFDGFGPKSLIGNANIAFQHQTQSLVQCSLCWTRPQAALLCEETDL